MYGTKTMYAVFVNGTRKTDYNLTESEAETLANEYESDGYEDVEIVEGEVENKMTWQDRLRLFKDLNEAVDKYEEVILDNRDDEDLDGTYEVCPHCGKEVVLEPVLSVQTCPHCGKRIVACSMCRACDSGEDYCTKCCLDYQAKAENGEIKDRWS